MWGFRAGTELRESLDRSAALGLKIEIADLTDGVSAAGYGSLTSVFVDTPTPELIKTTRLDATWLP